MSGIDISILLFRLLNVPPVTDLLDGSVYRFNRPINSRKRDIIVTIPEYNAGQFNTGYIDINIHVPNLELQGDQTSPDLETMQAITDAVLPILGGVDGYTLDVRIPGIPVRDKDGQWYCNIRIGFFGVDDVAGIDVTIIRLGSSGDGYGGSTPCIDPVWTGKAAMVDPVLGDQLELNAGKFEMEMVTDWVLPKEAEPEKGKSILTGEGEYVIRGIIPFNEMWKVRTVRKDGKRNVI